MHEVTKEVGVLVADVFGSPSPDSQGDSAGVGAVKVASSLPLAALGDSPVVRRGVAARSGEGEAWSGGRRGCGGPELRGAPGGRDLGAGGAAGERERVERALDLSGGTVVLQGV